MYQSKDGVNNNIDPRTLIISLQELSTEYHKDVGEMNRALLQAKDKYQFILNENNERIQNAQDEMSEENNRIQKEFEEIRKMYEKNLPELNEEKIRIQSQYYKEKSKFDCEFQTKVNEATNKLSEINIKSIVNSKENLKEIEEMK
ncbi:hypothetical protein FG386_000053, partial [Cryptosporidium ryanae]|uniref:uncharacterized protein n=1 Tax=Cryptosporidium ryanae TaxID=515981 RepID=UPI00351A1D4B